MLKGITSVIDDTFKISTRSRRIAREMIDVPSVEERPRDIYRNSWRYVVDNDSDLSDPVAWRKLKILLKA